MATPDPTETLAAHVRGDPGAADCLLPLVYEKLRELAQHYMGNERPGHTLQPTALVHEAYLRMIDVTRIDWQGKTHFMAIAARQMRRVLVDSARKLGRQKRGSRPRQVTLDEQLAVTPGPGPDVLILDETLARLAQRSSRQGRIAEMRLFGGLQVDEVAHVLDISVATVKRDWRVARAWLATELQRTQGK